MSKCKPIILSQGPQYCVSQCEDCQRVGLHYHHLMIGFELREFRQFTKQYLALPLDRHLMLFPDGSERIILNTPHPDIQLNLTRQEFNQLADLLQQARLMLDVRELI
ncbi:DUF6686 family protein [Reichenbachiella ulvae]|uniref:Uncharacterized protein n=1 Tax=Reichenbachiella ulvae TaxID=2980104 RepID=A0ABT3CYL2_9BACT|nr:DUF6686 family protein [Reichenbachiella ulvae]MCV9388644.1 hypothetical protein [Reichenbachiella ulvae]